jgi:serine/threonine protein kinase
VHHDVKPDNLLFNSGSGGAIRLGDFSFAA